MGPSAKLLILNGGQRRDRSLFSLVEFVTYTFQIVTKMQKVPEFPIVLSNCLQILVRVSCSPFLAVFDCTMVVYWSCDPKALILTSSDALGPLRKFWIGQLTHSALLMPTLPTTELQG